MGNSRTAKKVTSGKDKALMSVIRDCSLHPWCAHTMSITDTHITYQRPSHGVTFLQLFDELVNVEGHCELVEVKI